MFYSLYFKSGCYEYWVCNVGEKTDIIVAWGLNTVSVRVLLRKTLWDYLSLFSGSELREPRFREATRNNWVVVMWVVCLCNRVSCTRSLAGLVA